MADKVIYHEYTKEVSEASTPVGASKEEKQELPKGERVKENRYD